MNACALSGDITALKQCTDKIRDLAVHSPAQRPCTARAVCVGRAL
jgi:hypothetical protein